MIAIKKVRLKKFFILIFQKNVAKTKNRRRFCLVAKTRSIL